MHSPMSVLDIVIWLGFLFWTVRLIRRNRKNYMDFPVFFWESLAVYHFLLSAIAVYYVSAKGGDSIGYWNLTADTSNSAESWMEHWGYSTFFVQWLNYIPSKLLGLHYFTGCMMYSFLGLVGFFCWADLIYPFYQKIKSVNPFLAGMLMLSFFLPSLHFWNGLVGKEALLWFLVFLSVRMAKKGRLTFSFLLVFLAAWTRPVAGVLLLFFLISSLVFSEKLGLRWRIGVIFFGIVALLLGLGILKYITHLEEISWDAIQQFREGQYTFLDRFEAGSRISVEEMSLMEAVFTSAFRPFPGEINSFWGWMSGIENLIFLAISLGMIGLLFVKKEAKRQMVLSVILLGLALVYFLSIALSVNVLGIMIRLKTLAMPILIYLGFYGWDLIYRKFVMNKLT